MKRQYIDEIKGLFILAVAIILLASLLSYVPEDLSWNAWPHNVPARNLIGRFGASLAHIMFFVFGYSSYFIVFFLFSLSCDKFSSHKIHITLPKVLGFLVILCALSSLFGMTGLSDAALRFQRAGFVGVLISDFLVRYFGRIGSFIILTTLGLVPLILIGEVLVSPLLFKLTRRFQSFLLLCKDKIASSGQTLLIQRPRLKANRPAASPARDEVKMKLAKIFAGKEKGVQGTEGGPAQTTVRQTPQKPAIRVTEPLADQSQSPVKEKPHVIGDYHMPPLDLLCDPPAPSKGRLQENLMAGARILEETLNDFGVNARVADIEHGPVITRYELEPAPGVKVNRITTLDDDIALAMKAQSVRIIAPIPGKNRVGIEVPNASSSLVYLKEILGERELKSSKLNLALGKDTAGKSIIADLGDMPHLLIAGTTGSGKTVCVNSLIMSMVFNATPDEIKFLMVDPKMVELSIYNSLPHALCPAVTDPKKVTAALNWVVGEMENRYSLLHEAGVKNIDGFHKKGMTLPYIVVIIDELADLMQVAAKTIESAITRLAQLSRAVGIHLILATQRPSVDVITGVIKANFPARISFKVASKVDSRTVLDTNGAENLLGKGDMLFLKPGEAKPIRGQCSLVSDDEIQRVIGFLKEQQTPDYEEDILKKQSSLASGALDEKDELFDEAVRLVIETNQASVSILQRRMRLGYTRAARLIDMMEQEGIVGPYCGSKPRELLVNREEWLMNHMKTSEEE